MPIGPVDEVVVDCAEPGRPAASWAGVLGGDPVARSADWHHLDPPGCTRLAFQRVPEPKTVKNRLHLDVLADDLAAATSAAVQLGAVLVGEVVHDAAGSFQVLLDPEGDEWCVVRPAARRAGSPG